jgi:5'-3' exonuclease
VRLLFDGDMLIYRVGFRFEEESEEECLKAVQSSIDWFANKCDVDDVEVYLSCPRTESFRAKMNPNYKAHRSDRKPVHAAAIKQYLIDKYNITVPESIEADDLIGIEQYKDPDNTICCTVDKDILYGVVGGKCNFMDEEMWYTTEEDATFFFYKQLLMGDTADNVTGIPKIGDVKATKALNPYYGDEKALFDTVMGMYEAHYGDRAKEELLMTGRMLKIQEYPDQIWELPFE